MILLQRLEKNLDNPVILKDELGKVKLSGEYLLTLINNMLEIAVAILEDYGVKVEHARDGMECINMLMDKKADYYDLILMDVQDAESQWI